MRKLVLTTAAGPVIHELNDNTITLGRSPENTIQLDDPSVSGRHARLELAGEDYTLIDLDSTNGIRVNGQPIKNAILRAGDRIRFGKLEACFECETGAAQPPLPVVANLEAKPAENSARPADFGNASPFPRRSAQRDAVRTILLAAAALAFLAFLASMFALAQMQPPVL